MYPFVYPVDTCLTTSLVGSIYNMYRCVVQGNQTVLQKEEYSASDCSGNFTHNEIWRTNATTIAGLLRTFYCDGNVNNDYVFTLSGSVCGSSKDIKSVAGVCWYNSDANSTVTAGYTWACDTTGSTISFQTYSMVGARACGGTTTQSIDVSNSSCTTVVGLSAKISNNHCPVPSPSPSSSSSNAVILTVGVMSLIVSLFAIIFV